MAGEQNNVDFQSSQAVLFLEKYDELSNSMAFGQKLRYFTDQNGHEHEFCPDLSKKSKSINPLNVSAALIQKQSLDS